MRWLRVAAARLRGLLWPDAVHRDIDEELRCHIEMEVEANVRRGMSPEEARRAALRSFGNIGRIREAAREIRGGGMLETLWQDLRYGVRMFLKQPGFTLVAVLALALGIGSNTAIFSVVNAVLLRPLPYVEPERLVAVSERDTRELMSKGEISYPNFFDWRATQQSFERIAVYRGDDFTLTGTGAPLHLTGQVVSPDLFTLLGARPTLGRLFTPDEKPGGTGAGHAAVISHGLWQRHFGTDPNVIGRVITLDGKQFDIVGVMPAGFQFPLQADPVEVWVTSAVDAWGSGSPAEQRSFRWLQGIARLKLGVSLQQAQAEMDTIAANLEKQYTNTNAYSGATLIPFQSDIVADYRPALLVLLGAVGFVLAIACANVANLLLARATARQREVAVRTALGASRWRIIRQLLTESMLLAMLGGTVGLLLAWWGTGALAGLIPEDVPRSSEIRLDLRVLGFTLLTSTLTGLVFGLAPAVRASKITLSEAMKAGGGATGTSGRQGRLRSALVVVEVALALVLLVGAGLLAQTFLKLQQVDLGFDPHNVLTASVELPGARYAEPRQQADFFRLLLGRMKILPGVMSASAIFPLPLGGSGAFSSFEVEGHTYGEGELPDTAVRIVNLDYFGTMKIPVLKGRDFTDYDDLRTPAIAVVNESFAQRHFPNEDPVGKHVRANIPGIAAGGGQPWREIVAVVKDVKHRASLSRDSGVELYVPYAQAPFGNMDLVIRTEDDPRRIVKAVQAEVAALDKDIPLYNVKTLEQYLGGAVAQPKFSALLFGLFAAVALTLAAVGLYGVMAYSVVQRTHEIGIRMALGAREGNVLKLVVGEGMVLVLVGLGIGVVAALAMTRLMSSLLYGVSATDPVTFIGVAVLLTTVALLACFIPARRATKVNPMVALRHE